MTEAQPEAWLRGAVDGYDPLVMPAVHALVQAREDLESLVASVPPDNVWEMPGGAASVGFHVRHLGGALDRLFTYARGEALNDEQKAFARAEPTPGASMAELVAEASAAIDNALTQLRAAKGSDLLTPREVGRAKLPTTMLGALFHGAEHSSRHAGQAITTAKILSNRQ